MKHKVHFCIALLFAPLSAIAVQEMDHSGHNMQVSDTGIVMNENTDKLPRGCDSISTSHEFTVHAGREYASDAPGTMFGMDVNEWQVEPCSKITVNFINDDETRHQWMVHGLPKYLYPTGMFHIEAMGGQSQSGTFIVPGDDKNYLVHCDMSQHMEMGMRGQLIVGDGAGDLWGVTGITDAFYRSSYLPKKSGRVAAITLIVGFFATLLIVRYRKKA